MNGSSDITSYRHIWRLSWPIILSNLTLPLVGAVDVAMMGHLSHPAFVGAVGLGSLLFSLIYLGAGFLRMGTTGFTARAFGEENTPEIIAIILRALIIAAGLGLLGIVSSPVWLDAVQGFISASQRTEGLMTVYISIRIYELPAALINTALMGWFFGQQQMKTAMVHMVIVNLINIILNFVFVIQMGRDVDGVAFASVLAQYAGLGYFGLIMLMRRAELGLFSSGLNRQKIADRAGWIAFAKIGRDLGIRTVLIWAIEALLLSETAEMGEGELASMHIILTLFNFIAYGLDGFAHAAEALVGMMIGGRDPRKLKQVIWRGLMLSGGCAVGFAVFLFVADSLILGLMTSQTELRNLVLSHWLWVVLIPPASFLAFQMDGIFIGASEGRMMRNTTLACFTIFVLMMGLVSGLGLDGLLLAFIVYLVARGILLMLCLPVIYAAAQMPAAQKQPQE